MKATTKDYIEMLAAFASLLVVYLRDPSSGPTALVAAAGMLIAFVTNGPFGGQGGPPPNAGAISIDVDLPVHVVDVEPSAVPS